MLETNYVFRNRFYLFVVDLRDDFESDKFFRAYTLYETYEREPSSMTIHFNDGYLDLEEMQNKTTTSGFLMFMITC